MSKVGLELPEGEGTLSENIIWYLWKVWKNLHQGFEQSKSYFLENVEELEGVQRRPHQCMLSSTNNSSASFSIPILSFNQIIFN